MGNIVAKYKQKQLIANKFDMATRCLLQNDLEYSERDRMELYGLYKQATVGSCKTPSPDLTGWVAYQQWMAWKSLGELPVAAAKRLFIHKVQKLSPRRSCNCAKKKVGSNVQRWIRHTLPRSNMQYMPPETIFDLVRDKNLMGLSKKWHKSYAHVRDVHGMTLMHWAADRNAIDIIEFLMQHGCCVNELDPERQTPMHYAAINGHLKAVLALLPYHPRLDQLDDEGNSCFDLTNDKAILRTLQAEQELRDSKPAIYY